MKSPSILLSIVAAVTTTFVLSNSSAYADCTGDLNNDNVVDGVDLAILLNHWNSSNPQSDINSDGHINGQDLALLMGTWGNCGFSGSDSIIIPALGYNWITNSQIIPNPNTCDAKAAPPDSAPNFWLPANVDTVAVGSLCALRLTLAKNSGCSYFDGAGVEHKIWAAAQAVLALPTGTSLTYGKMLVTIAPVGGWAPFIGGCTGSNQNTTTTLGIFTYDPLGSAPHGEIDIVEVGYQNQNQAGSWINGQPSTPQTTDAQFCVQPWDGTNSGNPSWNNVHRISLDPSLIPTTTNEVTFMVDWQAGSLTFNAAYGQYTEATFPAKPPISWTLPPGTVIPAPTPTMSLYINLWPYGGPVTNDEQVQFVVTHLEVHTTTSP